MNNTVSALNKFTLEGKVALLVGSNPASTSSIGTSLSKAGARVFVTADTQRCIDQTLAAIDKTSNKGIDIGMYTPRETDIVSALKNFSRIVYSIKYELEKFK